MKYKLPKLIHEQATKTCNFSVEACNFLNELMKSLATYENHTSQNVTELVERVCENMF